MNQGQRTFGGKRPGVVWKEPKAYPAIGQRALGHEREPAGFGPAVPPVGARRFEDAPAAKAPVAAVGEKWETVSREMSGEWVKCCRRLPVANGWLYETSTRNTRTGANSCSACHVPA